MVGHAGEREHRRLVELGVVKAVQEMDRSWAGGREADAQPSGVLGVSAGRERGGLFVSDVNKTDTVPVLAQAFHQAVHAVAGQAENSIYPEVCETGDQDLAGRASRHIWIKRSFAPLHAPPVTCYRFDGPLGSAQV